MKTPRKQGRGAPKSDPVVSKALDHHVEKIAARSLAAQQRTTSIIDQRVLQDVLPFWDDNNRGVPNPLIRSGLFSVRNTEKREWMEIKMPSLSNYDIEYSGQDLQQDDLTIWMALVNLARNQPMSDAVYFTGYQLIKDIGWRMHTESYDRARDAIKRLKVTGIQIKTKDSTQGYSGSLIRDYKWAEKGQQGGEKTKWMVRFEPAVSILFMNDTTTLLDWEIRKKIGSRATTALWLHAFYQSHREPLPMGVEKIYELCRSGDTLSSFRRTLENALIRLVKVEFLTKYEIINDTVHVWRKVQPKLVTGN